MVLARLFGVYTYAQAFVVAFKLPNLFRDLVGEGAANAAFVPVFSEYLARHDKEDFWELSNVVLNLLLVILTAITLLGILFSPWLVRLIAPGFVAEPAKLAATIRLNRLVFPYILLVSLAAYATAILNSLRHFALPAFAPCLLNISIITCALLWGEGISGLASGVLLGGLLQLLVQLPLLYQKGFRFRPLRKFRHAGAKLIGWLMLPRLANSAIYQLNNFADSIFGSLAVAVGEGGVAVLYFAYRLILFPLGIFSNSLAQSLLPVLSTQALEPDPRQLKETLSFGLRASFFVLVPASAGFICASRLIIEVVFAGGRFDLYSIERTSAAFFYYSLGLFAWGTMRILQAGFFALKDTFNPTKISALSLGLNIALNTLLMFPLGIAGIALATSLSGIISCAILILLLARKLRPFCLRPILASLGRIVLASLAMGLVSRFLCWRGLACSGGIFSKLINLGFLIAFSAVAYLFFCFIFRVRELQELWGWLRRQRKTVANLG
jgi:putative peptidoglycan lipid II flippase